jgi:hypothetical protein
LCLGNPRLLPGQLPTFQGVTPTLILSPRAKRGPAEQVEGPCACLRHPRRGKRSPCHPITHSRMSSRTVGETRFVSGRVFRRRNSTKIEPALAAVPASPEPVPHGTGTCRRPGPHPRPRSPYSRLSPGFYSEGLVYEITST